MAHHGPLGQDRANSPRETCVQDERRIQTLQRIDHADHRAGVALGVSFLSLLVTHSVVAAPYISRTVLAVYRSVPPDFDEPAAVLGASKLQRFWSVTLAMIRPGIFAGGMFALLISPDTLPLSFFFGSANTNTLPVVMLSYMQNQFDPSIAAISTLQMLIAVAALGIVNLIYGIEKLTAA